MTRDAEIYFLEGCGRCSLGGTPDCKVHRWENELAALRSIVLEYGLIEECKWGVPCYTHMGKNIVMISALKEYCAISFFNGALLSDEHGILTFAGDHSQIDKMFRFTHLDELLTKVDWIKAYIFEAIELAKSGQKVQTKNSLELPEELTQKFEEMPALKAAFEALTPGRQRGWALHFSQPKQSQTREARIVKSMERILNGEGLHDKYGG